MSLSDKPFSNFDGIGSGGEMNNPMYRHIACIGTYEPQTGRCKRRKYAKRKYGLCVSKKKQFWELT